MNKKKIYGSICVWLGCLFFILLIYGKISLPQLLIYNHTPSVPYGWYLIYPSEIYHVGDLVVFNAPDEVQHLALERGWLQDGDFMLKRIGAIQGDSYKVLDNHQFFASDRYIGQIAIADHKGLPMPSLAAGEYVVGENNFLPIAEHPSSFDGRYYGEVPIKNIVYRVLPIWTWN